MALTEPGRRSLTAKVTLYADASTEIDRTDPANAVITRYPHPDLKIVASEASPDTAEIFYLHRDHLASVRQVTDATGTIAEATG